MLEWKGTIITVGLQHKEYKNIWMIFYEMQKLFKLFCWEWIWESEIKETFIQCKHIYFYEIFTMLFWW
jgi:hypothetical protein